ncbi:HD-GYP domain-containing protein, partial [Methylocucumis oryzae]
LALLLGKQTGLPEEALRAIGIGALLHDVGKLSFHPSMLRNQHRNKFEEAVYRTHCQTGYDAAVKANSLSPAMLAVILQHHERMDGSGFPDRLKGDEIPFAARMVAIANRFDNLTNPLDYLKAMSPSEALSFMWAKENKIYDSKLLQLFIKAMGVYPPGSVVMLSDNRVAAVVSSAPTAHPLSPQVLIYEPEIPRRQALIIDLAEETSIKIERPLRLSERPDEELDYLLPRRKISWFFVEGE